MGSQSNSEDRSARKYIESWFFHICFVFEIWHFFIDLYDLINNDTFSICNV